MPLLRTALLSLAFVAGAAAQTPVAKPLYLDPSQSVEARIDDLLPRLTLDEKISMLGGDQTGFNASGVPRLGIPPIRMSDGPVGVRTGEATAFPTSIVMAATWDPALIYRYGVALGDEAKAKGKNCILGPCVDIDRFPLGGRNFESFGEDPFLTASMAVPYIKGVQSQGVIATVKHFACNDQEYERNNYDVQVDERTLHEIHLVPFEAAVRKGHVLALMSAYNLVNGDHCSENHHLLTDILKDQWGFKGIVMSDWVSVYSADKAALAGLDLEMPQPIWFGARLKQAVVDGKVPMSVIDDKVRRLLRVRFEAGIFENPDPKPDESIVRSAAHRALALQIAQEGIVLLQNKHFLPLDSAKVKSIALIGPSAMVARTGGGGSSHVSPWRTTSPYAGLAALVGGKVRLSYAEGVNLDPFKPVIIPSSCLRTPDGKAQGLLGEYFANKDFKGAPLFTRVDPQIDFVFPGAKPDPRMPSTDYSIRWTGQFSVPKSGTYHLAVGSDDGSRLYIDGTLVVDNWGQHGDQYAYGKIELQAGRAYAIRIDYFQGGGDAAVHLGWKDPADKTPEPTIADAVAAAKKADVAILCVGNTDTTESEGLDVASFHLPGNQDALVDAVLRANPNTILVIYGGVPVRIQNWLARTKAVIAALYPGQEGGEALADILFGVVNPSGKLPFSYIQDGAQSPAFAAYKAPDNIVKYSEGVFVGYRFYDARGITPLYPFGYGLSYTKFDYRNLRIEKKGEHNFVVEADIANTGSRAGAEVVQVYVAPHPSPVPRPPKELKGYARVFLKPGDVKTVRIPLDARSFEYYDADASRWALSPGHFEIMVGPSSREFRLHDAILVK